MTDLPAEPATEEMITKLRRMAQFEYDELIRKFGGSLVRLEDFTSWKSADVIVSLTAAKEAAEKQLAETKEANRIMFTSGCQTQEWVDSLDEQVRLLTTRAEVAEAKYVGEHLALVATEKQLTAAEVKTKELTEDFHYLADRWQRACNKAEAAETKLHNLRLAHSDLYVEKDVAVAVAEKRAEALEDELGGYRIQYSDLKDLLQAAEKQCEELRRALEFYADPKTYKETWPKGAHTYSESTSPIKNDRGAWAAHALDSTSPKERDCNEA